LALAKPRCTAAAEGGGSHFIPGTFGDFAMAAIGPPGLYLRNDLLYLNADIGSVTLGKFALDEVNQELWVNIIKGIYLSKFGLLGSRFGAVIALPTVIDAHVSGRLVQPPIEKDGSRGGLGDISLTGFLNWSRGNFHTNVGLTTYTPSGSYDEDRVINLSRNYWTFDPAVTFTWLHAKRGHEVSVLAGTMFNTENDATDYQTGTEFHLGYVLGQHFSPRFGVGLEGYYYKQLTKDDGPLLDQANALGLALGGFKSEGVGLGPAVKWTPTIFGKNVNLIAKWIHDIDTTNRFEGYQVFLSVALDLWAWGAPTPPRE
jgi:hypothetical protein